MYHQLVVFCYICACFQLSKEFSFSKPQRGDMGDPDYKKSKLKDKFQDKNTSNLKKNMVEENAIVSPPPVGTGLYATVQQLQKQVLTLQQSYDKERSKIRRLERRVKECKDGVTLTKSDIVQIKQILQEVSNGYTDIQDLVQDVQTQNSGIDYEMKQSKKDFQMLNSLATSNSESLSNLWNNFTENHSANKSNQMRSEINSVAKKQTNLSKVLTKIQKDLKNVFAVSVNNSKTTYKVTLTNGTTVPKDIWEEIDLWGSGSGEIEKEFIIIGENNGEEEEFDVSGEGELLDIFKEYEDFLQPTVDKDYMRILKSNISHLEENLQNVTNNVKTMVSDNSQIIQNLQELLLNERAKSDALAEDQDEAIVELQGQYNSMVTKLNILDEKVQSIQLGDFMKSLQESLINFTQNVITLDQWKTASTQIINSTQYNQKQIMELKKQIVNNTNKVNEVDWVLLDNQGNNNQQYRVLQMHIIHLNNSLQDLREHVTYLGTIQLPSRRHPNGPGNTQYLPPATDILSRLEDLGLQITYNENRIANIESRVLNKSLFECQKANTDLFQDAKLLQLNNELDVTRSTVSILRETLKRLDRAIYRVYNYAKNSSDVINKVQSKFFSWDSYIPIIQLLRQEVNNVLYTLPIDCNAYYERGYSKSGIYVIFPPNALQSFKIPCVMDDEGGWTIIQHRFNGKTKFARTWSDYALGFGSPSGEFWIGNEFLHLLTFNSNYSLQIEMVDIFDGFWLVNYDLFQVSSKEDKYRLTVDGFSGNATDGMAYSNGMAFSTQDTDNDLSSTHCALYYTAGWWYRHCQFSNLNGRYDVGVVWFNKEWQDWIQLKSTTMKIRPQNINQNTTTS